MGNSGQLSTIHSKQQCLMTRKSSRTIAKGSRAAGTGGGGATPTIKVVHIFNPTVIKTDAANFRSLVQELTGRNYKSKGHDLRPKSNMKSSKQQRLQDAPLSPLLHSAKLLPSHGAHALQQNYLTGFYSLADSAISMQNSESDYSEQRNPFLDVNTASSYDMSPGSLFESSGSVYSDPRASVFEADRVNIDLANSCEALQVCNRIKLGVFSELQDREPVPYERGILSSMQKFPTFLNGVESASYY